MKLESYVAASKPFLSRISRLVSLPLQEYGRIDVLVNNASVLGPSPMPYLLDYPADDFLEVLRINAAGPFLVTQKVLGAMLQQGAGSVINVTWRHGMPLLDEASGRVFNASRITFCHGPDGELIGLMEPATNGTDRP